MSEYHRFVSCEPIPSLTQLALAQCQLRAESDTILRGDTLVAQYEINSSEESVFQSDIDLIHRTARSQNAQRQALDSVLKNAVSMVVVSPYHYYNALDNDVSSALFCIWEILFSEFGGALVFEEGWVSLSAKDLNVVKNPSFWNTIRRMFSPF